MAQQKHLESLVSINRRIQIIYDFYEGPDRGDATIMDLDDMSGGALTDGMLLQFGTRKSIKVYQ